ncbi:MAG: DUF5119 domain-containing protein [Muribaculaceae bacterium]|nr:DUF5119 domain-containing protein [Muribaculaceae bacterium]
MNRSGIVRLFVCAVLVLLTAACNHREFDYQLPSARVPVVVEFNWELDQDAAPEGMTVYFYRSGSSRAIAYDFNGRDGGSLTLLPGTYSAICHNNDSDVHGFVGYHSFDEFGLRLNDHRTAGNAQSFPAQRADGVDERIAYTPDLMWVSSIPVFVIEPSDNPDVKSRTPVVLRFDMQPVVHHYTVHITNPINFNKSVEVHATISGMASTVHPGKAVTGDETVTHHFTMQPTSDGNLRADFLTFGHCGGNPLSSRGSDDEKELHILSVYATMPDGKEWTSVHDVTTQLHSSVSLDCVVRLDSVSFPQHTGSGGGWAPSVDDWGGGHREPIGM